MSVQSIISCSGKSDCDGFSDWFRLLRDQLGICQQRCLLCCEGSALWCDQLRQQIELNADEPLLLSDQTSPSHAVSFSKSETLLGREFDIVLVNLFGGFNPDVICIAAGLVRCGGVLILLSPGAAKWHELDDRYAIWQNQVSSPKNHFVDYFFAQIEAGGESCIRLEQHSDLPALPDFVKASPTELINHLTSDQTRVVGEMVHWLGQSKQPVGLITADRGRGKSTCLGILVDQLSKESSLSICVTAYSRQSAAILLEQTEKAEFYAPDKLIEANITADLLLIDEAAMLPFAMLNRLCRQFSRIIMVTTTGGYEGTGQGFMLRFVDRLKQGELTWWQLHQPVRWADNDCLERWVDNTLLLKPVQPVNAMAESDEILDSSSCEYSVIERGLDFSPLTRFYRLMLSAHYRSRPSDYRALMENPDLTSIAAHSSADLLGGILLNREGGLDEKLCEQIFLGNRRPKGHLFAQMLTAQAGLEHFACYRGLRIQRIAVCESHRRKGIGRQLIQNAEALARKNKDDYIGASFAFDSDSAGFWHSCGFKPVHIGYGQGKSTGNHSVAVIKILNPLLALPIDQLAQKLQRQLPMLLCQYLNQMEINDVIALLRFAEFKASLSDIEQQECRAFIHGNKGFESCFIGLQSTVMQAIAHSFENRNIHPWLIEKAVLNRSWDSLSPLSGCSGRKSKQNKLRQLIGELIT